MHTITAFRPSLALILLLATEVLADDDDTDFLMNVFSDLGPVLALFGEQFARQFLSETFTWYDHLIFACVPLGIMTAIAGAIRVEGRPVLKAFIGRARQNKAAAEIEYMSSTSAEVGELFNGNGIVRTLGQSNIIQFIVFPQVFNSDESAFSETLGIHTLRSATEEGKEVLKKEDYRDELDVRFMKWFKGLKVRPISRQNEPEDGVQDTNGERMSLFWVQGKQRVSDQEFGSYVIFAQDKKFFSTSSRKEDIDSNFNNRDNQIQTSQKGNSTTEKPKALVHENTGLINKAEGKLSWSRDIRAFIALLGGGAGFTIQFIGLRGLPWPVAVAHLGALIIMAVIRALVRRRLGEDTQYRKAPSDYELDYLATQLVKTECGFLPPLEGNTESPQRVLLWRVYTGRYDKGTIDPFDFPGPLEPDVASNSEAKKVMLTRKRLGDLCEWETRAFKPALTLVRSVEHFLDVFAPEGLSNEDSIIWKIPLKSPRDKSRIVELEVVKAATGWKIDAGKVEAILSIWMAHLEIHNTAEVKKDGNTERQRSRAGVALGVDYCRILGRKYDNGVLLRDIYWWVSNPAITEIEVEKQEPEARLSPQPTSSRTTSFQLQRSTAINRSTVLSPVQTTPANVPQTYDRSKYKYDKIVIGCTAPANTDGPHTLYVQHSTAVIATIAVQHLFTHFIWTIVDLLPKNFLGQGSINVGDSVSVASSSKSGIDRKLKGEKIDKFTLRAGKEGLGTSDDILLCLIPVLSITDRLPNDATFEFDLPKLAERKDWPKAADRFSELLKSMPKSPDFGFEDSLTLTAVVRALDYLYLMALDEKYLETKKPTKANTESEQSEIDETDDFSTKPNIPQSSPKPTSQEPADELRILIRKIYPGAIEKLWWFYGLQRREEFFLDLKDNAEEKIPKENFMEHIRFTKLHQHIANGRRLYLGDLQGTILQTRDIFGWTALHYAAACRDLKIIGCNTASETALSDGQRPKNWWLDNFGRSPIHIAALNGNSIFLVTLLTNMSDHDVRSTLQSSGLDGMTPVHLAIAGGHKECLDILLKFLYSFELEITEDAWNRSPVHLALAQGQYSFATALLENGELKFEPSALDIFGKSPLSYLDENIDEQKEIGRLLLRKYSEKFQKKDDKGSTVWHHATRFLSNEIGDLSHDDLLMALKAKHKSIIDSMDKAQETPLHLAVRRNNDALLKRLLSLGASLFTDKYRSPLMLACSLGRLDMVIIMLRSDHRAAEYQDRQGKLALHYVAKSKNCDSDVCHDIISKLVKAMKSAGMKGIDIKDNRGRTPLHIATENANISAVSTLLNSGADPSTKNKEGDNALHCAVFAWGYDGRSAKECQDITRELVTRAPGCLDALNERGNTPLTWACRFRGPLGFIYQVVMLSKEKGSKINLNKPDDVFGRSPLTWACERGVKVIVKILLESPTVDLDPKSSDSMKYTPLCFALEKECREIVEMLVCNPKRHANINMPPRPGYADALEFACQRSNEDCVRSLLVHPEATTPMFLTSVWKRAVQQPSRIESMPWFVHEWEDAILDPLNNVPFPLHELAEVGRFERCQSLLQTNQLHHELDDNGWTPADVASRYGHHELAVFLRQDEPERNLSEDHYVKPSTFINLFKGSDLVSSNCSSHPQCSAEILDVKLPKNDHLDNQYCYLRTKEPIPPKWRYFYFEVNILRSLKMKEFVVGFCQSDVPKNTFPGCHDGSFAYHGDDGGLYVGNEGDGQKSDETFEDNDIVGCGLNFETGHGYRTKNGVLLGSSFRFQEKPLSTGRFYPYIGAGTDGEGDQFQIHITLRSSAEYPFHYKGPYDGLLLRTEWSDSDIAAARSEEISDIDAEDETEER
ncbi:hypothetical protein FSHL1_006581 [Fusarium sambucinum]